ncbi:ATP-dependent metallopeptidase FtsH/Yme1/Tma family protein [Nonomuraea wenchangensis]
MLVIAHVFAGVLAAYATYDPYGRRDISYILQKVHEGQVSEATLIYDEQRISVSTRDGQKWYARYGPPGLSHEALLEELGKADPLGNLKVTVKVSVYG